MLLGTGSTAFPLDSSLLGRLNSVTARLMPNDLGVSKHHCAANMTDKGTSFRCLPW